MAAVVAVPSATFSMGAQGERESRPRRVHVEAFEIDVTEVTVEAYESSVVSLLEHKASMARGRSPVHL